MPIDSEAQRDRQRRLNAGRVTPLDQPSVREVPPTRDNWIRVVLRSVELGATNRMTFQRVRYNSVPPVIGDYEAFGEILTAYPLETADFKDYEVFAWPEQVPEEDANGDPVLDGNGNPIMKDNPISQRTVPLLADLDARGFWILMIPLKCDASLLPADEPSSGCSFA